MHRIAQYAAMTMQTDFDDRTPALADTFPFEEPAHAVAGGGFGLLVREPVGVVGAIIPWNARCSSSRTRSGPRCWPAARSC